MENNHIFMTANNYSQKHFLQIGDILFARTGGTVGKTYYYDGTIGNAIFAGYCIRFRFDVSKVLPKFVYWNTKTNSYLKWVKGIQRPSGQPNINKEEFKSYKIFVPNYTKQKQLCSFMDEAEKKYNKKLQQVNELLSGIHNDIISALKIKLPKFEYKLCGAIQLKNIIEDKIISTDYYHSERMSVIKLIKNKKNFNAKKLSEIVDFCRDIVASGQNSENYLGLAGVESQTGELSGISEEVNGQAFKFEKHDILYCRLRPYLNKVICTEKSGICSTEFHVMRVKNAEEILPEFLAAVMRSNLILMQTKHMMTGNTHPRISNDDVKNLYIPIPDISLQKDICMQLQKKRQQAKKLKLEAEKEWAEAKVQFEKELLGE